MAHTAHKICIAFIISVSHFSSRWLRMRKSYFDRESSLRRPTVQCAVCSLKRISFMQSQPKTSTFPCAASCASTVIWRLWRSVVWPVSIARVARATSSLVSRKAVAWRSGPAIGTRGLPVSRILAHAYQPEGTWSMVRRPNATGVDHHCIRSVREIFENNWRQLFFFVAVKFSTL